MNILLNEQSTIYFFENIDKIDNSLVIFSRRMRGINNIRNEKRYMTLTINDILCYYYFMSVN